MRATVLSTDSDTTNWLDLALTLAEIPHTLVGSLAALHRAVERADCNDFLLLECLSDRPNDIDRCRQILQRAGVDIYLVYSQEVLLHKLRKDARSPIIAVASDIPWPTLMKLLRTRRQQAITAQVQSRRRVLSPQQRRIAGYIAQDFPQDAIASELKVHVGTVKRQVGRILEKWQLNSTKELKIALRFLSDEEFDKHGNSASG